MANPLHSYEWGTINKSNPSPTPILLHYFGGSGQSFAAVGEGLAQRGIRCLAPDLAGFGGFGNRHTRYSLEGMADDILAFAEKEAPNGYALVGHSMSGKIALLAAARRPAGLRGLVLVAASPPTPEPMDEATRARMLATRADPDAARQTVNAIIAAPPAPPDLEAAFVRDQLACRAPAWRWWLTTGSKEDISGRMSALSLPALVLCGDADKSLGESVARQEILPYLPDGSRFDIIADAGHLIPQERPEALIDAILAWQR